MKKMLSLLLMITMVFSLGACGQSDQAETSQPLSEQEPSSSIVSETAAPVSEAQQQAEPSFGEDAGGNILVAYFSWADNAILADDVDAMASPSVVPPGNVQQLAGWVQDETGGDLFSIRVTDPYPSDWDECLARANEERGDNARPELVEPQVENLDQYDTVFLGYPKMEQGFLSV